MHGIHEICCGLPRASECPNGQRSGLNVKDFEDFAAHDGLQLITPSGSAVRLPSSPQAA
jgi:hypothetical protein